MQSATSTTHTLEIEGMSGDVCVKKVTEALKGVQGVTTQSVKVGKATITADQAGCDAACTAIKGAGFEATADAGDEDNDNDDNESTGAQSKSSLDLKSNNQSRTPGQNAGGDKPDAGNSSYSPKNNERSNQNERSTQSVSSKPTGMKM